MKLKDILEESIGGIVFPQALNSPFRESRSNSSLVKVAKEVLKHNSEASIMEKEELVSSVNKFQSLGKDIYGPKNIAEIGQQLVKMAEASQQHVVDETKDWFDAVTVKRNMTELKNHANKFNKLASEAKALQDRMSALYEDMGMIYNRYFEIQEIKEIEDAS